MYTVYYTNFQVLIRYVLYGHSSFYSVESTLNLRSIRAYRPNTLFSELNYHAEVVVRFFFHIIVQYIIYFITEMANNFDGVS